MSKFTWKLYAVQLWATAEAAPTKVLFIEAPGAQAAVYVAQRTLQLPVYQQALVRDCPTDYQPHLTKTTVRTEYPYLERYAALWEAEDGMKIDYRTAPAIPTPAVPVMLDPGLPKGYVDIVFDAATSDPDLPLVKLHGERYYREDDLIAIIRILRWKERTHVSPLRWKKQMPAGVAARVLEGDVAAVTDLDNYAENEIFDWEGA